MLSSLALSSSSTHTILLSHVNQRRQVVAYSPLTVHAHFMYSCPLLLISYSQLFDARGKDLRMAYFMKIDRSLIETNLSKCQKTNKFFNWKFIFQFNWRTW